MTSSIIAGSREPLSIGNKEGVKLRLDITSYPTNGEPLTAALLGMESGAKPFVVAVTPCEPAEAANNLVHPVYDRANGKLKFIVCSTGVEVANGTDLGEFQILATSGTGA